MRPETRRRIGVAVAVTAMLGVWRGGLYIYERDISTPVPPESVTVYVGTVNNNLLNIEKQLEGDRDSSQITVKSSIHYPPNSLDYVIRTRTFTTKQNSNSIQISTIDSTVSTLFVTSGTKDNKTEITYERKKEVWQILKTDSTGTSQYRTGVLNKNEFTDLQTQTNRVVASFSTSPTTS